MTAVIEVVDWISYEAAEKLPRAVGALGGLWRAQLWEEYLEDWSPEVHPYLEAIRKAVVERKIWEDGWWHQGNGCPLFSDNTAGCFSMRAWGDLISAIWNTELGRKDYFYNDFHCWGAPPKPQELL